MKVRGHAHGMFSAWRIRHMYVYVHVEIFLFIFSVRVGCRAISQMFGFYSQFVFKFEWCRMWNLRGPCCEVEWIKGGRLFNVVQGYVVMKKVCMWTCCCEWTSRRDELGVGSKRGYV